MRIKPTVIKKLVFNSGNKSVSRIPLVSITGFTALNNRYEALASNVIIISFINHDDIEPDDTENGVTKKMSTRRRVAPKITQEYLVFSLYWTM